MSWPAAFPWPPGGNGSVPESLVRTWRDSVLAPGAFYARMPRAGGLGAAIVYFLIVGIAASGIQLFWQMVLGPVMAGDAESLLGRALPAAGDGAVGPLLSFLFSPVLLLVTLALSTAVVHLVLWLLGGVEQPIATTARVFCFAYGPQLLVIVPLIGMIAASIWTTVLAITGLRVAHGTSTARAAIAVLLPILLLIAMYAIIALAVMVGRLGVALGGSG